MTGWLRSRLASRDLLGQNNGSYNGNWIMTDKPSKRARKTSRHLRQEFNELGYWNKLKPEDQEWMEQFMYEYYQSDFNFEKPLHPKELRKDCQHRNAASRSQVHSVGTDLLEESARRAYRIQTEKKYRHMRRRFYTNADWEPKDPTIQETDDVE